LFPSLITHLKLSELHAAFAFKRERRRAYLLLGSLMKKLFEFLFFECPLLVTCIYVTLFADEKD